MSTTATTVQINNRNSLFFFTTTPFLQIVIKTIVIIDEPLKVARNKKTPPKQGL